jgi:hypothetical protein
MTRNQKRLVWIIGVPAISAVHGLVALGIFSMLFGWADGGGGPSPWITTPLAVLVWFMAPLAPLANLCMPPPAG